LERLSGDYIEGAQALTLCGSRRRFQGPLRPPYLLAKELKNLFPEITFVSPSISDRVIDVLGFEGFNVCSLGNRFLFNGSLRTFESWLRRVRINVKDDNAVIINFSQSFLVDAHVYYAQGPVTKAIDDMYSELKPAYRVMYRLSRALLVWRDKLFNCELRKRSRLFIANSFFCKSMYESWGIRVDGVIYPPLDTNMLRPTTSRPSEDYILTYIGKETKFSILKRVADAGVKIKAFGCKAPYIPRYTLKHPNIEFLGCVSDEELADLYSNALFTLLVFTHEPFGYIPVESMTCGTPVLTCNRQGPSETVVHGVTGWLANSDEELVSMAIRIWREGYPNWMRSRCRERALQFDAKAIASQWIGILKKIT